jgi:hypothetical protein
VRNLKKFILEFTGLFPKIVHQVIVGLPITNLKNLLALVAAFGSVCCFWLAVFLEKQLDYVVFGMILSFVFSWLYDGRKQFAIKRDTEWVPEGYRVPRKSKEMRAQPEPDPDN